MINIVITTLFYLQLHGLCLERSAYMDGYMPLKYRVEFDDKKVY